MMYERLKNALQENGELMLRMASGEDVEIHLHNTEFKEEPIIEVEGQDETHWLNAEEVERYWIHNDF